MFCASKAIAMLIELFRQAAKVPKNVDLLHL